MVDYIGDLEDEITSLRKEIDRLNLEIAQTQMLYDIRGRKVQEITTQDENMRRGYEEQIQQHNEKIHLYQQENEQLIDRYLSSIT